VQNDIAKVPNQKVTKCPKSVFFFLSSDGIVQNCAILSQWFLHKTATVHDPIAFSQHHKKHTQELICDTIFSHFTAFITQDHQFRNNIQCTWDLSTNCMGRYTGIPGLNFLLVTK